METLTESHSIWVLGALSCRWFHRLKYLIRTCSRRYTEQGNREHSIMSVIFPLSTMTGSWREYGRVVALWSDISLLETERRNVRVIVRPIVDMTFSERSTEKEEYSYYLRLLVWDQLQTGKESDWGTKKRRKARCQTYHERWESLEFGTVRAERRTWSPTSGAWAQKVFQ